MISNITHSLKVKTAQLGAMYRDGAQRNIAKLFTVNLTKQNKLITVSVRIYCRGGVWGACSPLILGKRKKNSQKEEKQAG